MSSNRREVLPEDLGSSVPDIDVILAQLPVRMCAGKPDEARVLSGWIRVYAASYHREVKFRRSPGGDKPNRDKDHLAYIAKLASKAKLLVEELGFYRKEGLLIAYAEQHDPVDNEFIEFYSPDADMQADLMALDRLSVRCLLAREGMAPRGRIRNRAPVLLVARVGHRALEWGLLKTLGTSRSSQYYALAKATLALVGYHAAYIDEIVTEAKSVVYGRMKPSPAPDK